MIVFIYTHRLILDAVWKYGGLMEAARSFNKQVGSLDTLDNSLNISFENLSTMSCLSSWVW